MVKCVRGHFYDPAKYRHCPYCFQREEAQYTLASDKPLTVALDQDLNHYPQAPFAVDKAAEKERQPVYHDDQVTLSYADKELGFNPPCGFLTCYAGKEKGKFFPIYARRNTLGRSQNMDIPLFGDLGISRSIHAILSFDPKTNHFTLIPDLEKSIVYVNGKECLSPLLLSAYDRIEISDTGLVFLPLCGERFSWHEEEHEQ